MKKIILILSIITVTAACKKEGCIDKIATNYNSLAKKDNGTCTYESSVTFWWSEATWPALYYNIDTWGTTNVRIYIDDELFAIEETLKVFWESEPNCENESPFKYTLKMNSNTIISKSYKVLTDDKYEIWSGTIDFKPGECSTIKLAF